MNKIYKQPNTRLSKKQCTNIISSVGIAYEKSIQLNRYITINLDQLCNGKSKELLDLFIKNYRSFCQRKNIEPAYVWVLENKNVGVHVHILLHYPPTTDRSIYQLKNKIIKSWLSNSKTIKINKPDRWIKIITIPYGIRENSNQFWCALRELNRGIRDQQANSQGIADLIIGDRSDCHWGEVQFDNAIRRTAYLCKGIEKGSQGAIQGRRVGRSRNLIMGKKKPSTEPSERKLDVANSKYDLNYPKLSNKHEDSHFERYFES